MNFLAPWAFGFAALAPVIVLLYLLKLRRQPVSVSTLLFWQRVLEETRRRALFQRLRNLLSLLLHLLIFVLILLALAKPVLDRAVHSGVSTVLVLDTRARMQAMEKDGVSRFEHAKKLAKDYTGQAGQLREMAILAAGAESRVIVPFSGDDSVLNGALAHEEPTDAGGNLNDALELADQLLASRAGERRIVLLTDKSTIDWKPKTPGAVLDVLPTGLALENVAITRFACRVLPASVDTCEILMEIRNFGNLAQAGNVEIRLENKLLDVRPFQLSKEERRTMVFSSIPIGASSSPESPGWLSAKLDTEDSLQCDNEAYALLPKQVLRQVLLVTKGNWFLEKLLSADARVRFDLLEPGSFRPALAGQFDVTIFDRFVPPGVDLSTLSNNAMFIRNAPFPTKEKVVGQPLVSEVDEHHPAVRLVSLQNVTIARAAALTVPQESHGWHFQTPLQSFENPLLITAERSVEGKPQRAAILAFDIAESDLPLRIAFPLLVGNLLQWLAGDDVTPTPSIRAGETAQLPEILSISGPMPVTSALATAPNPKLTRTVPPANPSALLRALTFRPLQNGIYAVAGASSESFISVNTFDERESDLAAASTSASTTTPILTVSSAASGVFGLMAGWPLWRYLATAAVALLCGEWWLFHRRRTE